MVAVVEDKLDAIAALCRKYRVVNLHVFGSAVGPDFEPGEATSTCSSTSAPWMDTKAHAYFDLLEELRDVLGTEVDLVMAGAVKNRYISR